MASQQPLSAVSDPVSYCFLRDTLGVPLEDALGMPLHRFLHDNVKQLLDVEDLARYLRLDASWQESRIAVHAEELAISEERSKVFAATEASDWHQSLFKTAMEDYETADGYMQEFLIEHLNSLIKTINQLENTLSYLRNVHNIHNNERREREAACKLLEARMNYLYDRATTTTTLESLPATKFQQEPDTKK